MTNTLNIILCEISKLIACLVIIIFFIFEGLSVIILFLFSIFFIFKSCENVLENYLISLSLYIYIYFLIMTAHFYKFVLFFIYYINYNIIMV